MAAKATNRPRSNSWIAWLAAGCALLVVVVFGLGVVIWWIVSSVVSGAAACVPSDFPNYPNTVWGGSGAGGGGCIMERLTTDDTNRIFGFYEKGLTGGNWTITAVDRTREQINFEHARGPHITGYVGIVDQSVFHYRAICLSFDRTTVAGGATLLATRKAVPRRTHRGLCF